jgi:hypothetical protein
MLADGHPTALMFLIRGAGPSGSQSGFWGLVAAELNGRPPHAAAYATTVTSSLVKHVTVRPLIETSGAGLQRHRPTVGSSLRPGCEHPVSGGKRHLQRARAEPGS